MIIYLLLGNERKSELKEYQLNKQKTNIKQNIKQTLNIKQTKNIKLTASGYDH